MCKKNLSIDTKWEELVAQVNDAISVGQLRSFQSLKCKCSVRMIFGCIAQSFEHVPGKATLVGFDVRRF